MQAVAALPMAQQFVRLAELGKLYGFAAARGLPEVRAKACLADAALIEKVAANRKEAVETFGLTGTPTFVLDGKTLEGVLDWGELEPRLAAAIG
jgi:protein-disulfide isomerase